MKKIYLIATATILSISSLGLAQEKKSNCIKIDKNENGTIPKSTPALKVATRKKLKLS